MAQPANKRSVMALYAVNNDPYSHRVRMVLAEKGINVEIIPVSPPILPEELLQINPYGNLPTMVDRDLVLYETTIITEYLDERFPHPPLLPVYPVARAKSRQMVYRIERDWYPLLLQMENKDEKNSKKAQKKLEDSLISLSPLLSGKPYFLSEEFTLVDCCIAPLLWRLQELGVEYPKTAKPLELYAERLFKRASFKTSLIEN